MFGAVDSVGFAFKLDPAFARRGFDTELAFERLQIARVMVEQLLGDARVFEMESFGRHGRRVSSVGCRVSGSVYSTFAMAARSSAASSVSAWGTTVVLPRTGMKLVSPFQRGTM